MRKLKNWLIRKLGGIPRDTIAPHLLEQIEMSNSYYKMFMNKDDRDIKHFDIIINAIDKDK